MSIAHPTTPAAAAEAAGEGRRPSLLRWLPGGALVAAGLAAVAIAVWPASEADKAYADGERYGEAVSSLYAADSSAEVDAALTEMEAAAADAGANATDAVADQVAAQEDALSRAANGFVGALTTDDAFEAELYEYELDVALTDLGNNAEDFRTTGPEVQQAFWGGYEAGLDG
jgi:hypothetical protein